MKKLKNILLALIAVVFVMPVAVLFAGCANKEEGTYQVVEVVASFEEDYSEADFRYFAGLYEIEGDYDADTITREEFLEFYSDFVRANRAETDMILLKAGRKITYVFDEGEIDGTYVVKGKKLTATFTFEDPDDKYVMTLTKCADGRLMLEERASGRIIKIYFEKI